MAFRGPFQSEPFCEILSCPSLLLGRAGYSRGWKGKGLGVLLLGRDIGFCPGKAEGDGFGTGRALELP